MTDHKREPGDDILDRYVPHLAGPDRELARERLQKLARLLVRIAIREERHVADSRESGSGGTISPTPKVAP